MKRKLFVAALLLLSVLTFAACAQKAQIPQGNYQLYYAAQAESARGEDAIAEYPVKIADESCTTQELAQKLLEMLLLPPEDPLLLSPFPNGTQVQELSISGKRA